MANRACAKSNKKEATLLEKHSLFLHGIMWYYHPGFWSSFIEASPVWAALLS